MNPFGLDATGLMVWGLVAHLIADWPLQNHWMANCKALRRTSRRSTRSGSRIGGHPGPWWDRHPAAYVHAGIHGALLALVFGWVAAPLALVHLVIDTRVPVVWWSRLVRQTQPGSGQTTMWVSGGTGKPQPVTTGGMPAYDVGLEVRFWTDQVFHIACIAVVALVVA